MLPKAASRPKAQNEPTWRMAVTPVGHFACVQDGCDYTSPRKQDVKRHHNKHLAAAEKDKLSVACTWPGCTKKFLQKSNADTHMRVHTHERNQVCPEDGCDYTNTDPSSLIRHRRRKHGYQSNAGPRQSQKRALEGTSSDVAEPTRRKRAKTETSTVEDDELHSISAPSPAASTYTNDSFYPPSSAVSPPAMYPSLPEPQYDGGSEYKRHVRRLLAGLLWRTALVCPCAVRPAAYIRLGWILSIAAVSPNRVYLEQLPIPPIRLHLRPTSARRRSFPFEPSGAVRPDQHPATVSSSRLHLRGSLSSVCAEFSACCSSCSSLRPGLHLGDVAR
ncbi:hypothetical protein C8F01DRAFT_333088 [Mycena amicta]|nr:hypothetical protein C8F01DRAFT_333088 [Mycena amicta]